MVTAKSYRPVRTPSSASAAVVRCHSNDPDDTRSSATCCPACSGCPCAVVAPVSSTTIAAGTCDRFA